MLGLVLEGGGARGAYEIGAVRAFIENGYKFDGVVGTSIGSINAAAIAQGDFEKAYELWQTISPSLIFPDDEKLLSIIADGDVEIEELPEMFRKITALVKNKGIDTSHIKAFLNEYIDEKKLRESETEFGLVTFSISDRKSVELFKNDIPEGTLVDYLLASSMLPLFKKEKLDGKFFADGGYSDVCPYNMLIDRGYDELVIIRVFGVGITKKMRSKKTKIQTVIPSDKLPGMLDFSREAISSSMKMGYYDALRVIKGYKGRKYYIEPKSEEYYFGLLTAIQEKYIRAVGNILELPNLPGKRLLFDGIIPVFAACLELPENYTYEELFIAILESACLAKDIPRFELQSFEKLLETNAKTVYPSPDKKYCEINFPYRNPTKTSGVFKLPMAALPTSYSYKLPGKVRLGNAIEIFLRALSETGEI